MNILNFVDHFPDEHSCREHFRLQREKEGIKCKKCHNEKHYWLKAKYQWQCSSCNFRTLLTERHNISIQQITYPQMVLCYVSNEHDKEGYVC